MLVTADIYDREVQRIDDLLTEQIKSGNALLAFDTETTGLDIFHGHRICGVSLATYVDDSFDTWYFPFRHGQGDNLPLDLLSGLSKLLYKTGVTLVTWNGKFDLKMLLADGFGYHYNLEDVMIASHLVDENQPSFRLKDQGKWYIDENAADEMIDLADELKANKWGKGDMWRLPAERVTKYAEKDADLTLALRAYFAARLTNQGLYRVWQDINRYLVVVTKMEMRGLKLDVPTIHSSIKEATENAKKAYDALATLVGHAVNPNSHPQMVKLLGVPSTAVDVLEGMDHPAVPYILDYRRWLKAKSTYYDKFLAAMDANQILHPNLNMIGTVTGRFSCDNPNLQAMPRKEDEFMPKELVKRSVVSRPGYSLVQIDYKQAEVYLGAHYAQAKRLIAMLRAKIDVHGETAKLLERTYKGQHVPRVVAKRLNFAQQYGIGDDALKADMWKHARLKISLEEAHQFRAMYDRVHPEMKALYRRSERVARAQGYISLFTGRRRHYNGLEYNSMGAKASPYHKASSNLIQGGVAEIMRIASMRIDKEFEGQEVFQLLHVHDSIILEIKDELVDQAIPRIVELMTDFKITVPLRVDVEIGHCWYDLQPYEVKEVESV